MKNPSVKNFLPYWSILSEIADNQFFVKIFPSTKLSNTLFFFKCFNYEAGNHLLSAYWRFWWVQRRIYNPVKHHPLTIFTKSSVLHIGLGAEGASEALSLQTKRRKALLVDNVFSKTLHHRYLKGYQIRQWKQVLKLMQNQFSDAEAEPSRTLLDFTLFLGI